MGELNTQKGTAEQEGLWDSSPAVPTWFHFAIPTSIEGPPPAPVKIQQSNNLGRWRQPLNTCLLNACELMPSLRTSSMPRLVSWGFGGCLNSQQSLWTGGHEWKRGGGGKCTHPNSRGYGCLEVRALPRINCGRMSVACLGAWWKAIMENHHLKDTSQVPRAAKSSGGSPKPARAQTETGLEMEPQHSPCQLSF